MEDKEKKYEKQEKIKEEKKEVLKFKLIIMDSVLGTSTKLGGK